MRFVLLVVVAVLLCLHVPLRMAAGQGAVAVREEAGDWRAPHREAVRLARAGEIEPALEKEKAALDRFLFGNGPDSRKPRYLRMLVRGVGILHTRAHASVPLRDVFLKRIDRLDRTQPRQARYALTILDTMLKPPFRNAPALTRSLCNRMEELAADVFGPQSPETIRALLTVAEVHAQPVSAWYGKPLGARKALRYIERAKRAASFLPPTHPIQRDLALSELRLLQTLQRDDEMLARFRAIMATPSFTEHFTREQRKTLLKLGLYALFGSGHESEALPHLRKFNALRAPDSPPEALYRRALPPHAEEGGVEAEIVFDIDARGRVVNPRIRFLKGKRSRHWLREARRIVASWRFAPRLQDGRPVPTHDHREPFAVRIVAAP